MVVPGIEHNLYQLLDFYIHFYIHFDNQHHVHDEQHHDKHRYRAGNL